MNYIMRLNNSNNKIYARCRRCPAKLIYHRVDEHYELQKINSFHKHRFSLRKNKQSELTAFFDQLPAGVNIYHLKKLVKA